MNRPLETVASVLHDDSLCDRYEDELKAGRVVPAAEFLRSVGIDPTDASTVLDDLAQLEAEYRSGSAQREGVPAVPGYEVLEEIGHGGMGVVYRARQIGLNREVALKVLLGGAFASATQRERSMVEAESVALLDHPHVVRVFDFGHVAGHPYLAMELLSGGTLAERIKTRGPMPGDEAAEMVARLAAAAAHAHSRGVIHRDIKPANVLFGADGQPRLADFGLAKLARSDQSLSATGDVLGTAAYMPPEQARGNVREVGTVSDVYALGALLYELLTGRPPFEGESAAVILQKVMTQEPRRPRSLNPNVPRDLETICLKCLDKNPAKRYPTAAALLDDLQAHLNGRPIGARPVGQMERALKWVKRNWVVSLALASVALALFAGTVVSYVSYREASAQKEVAEQNEREAERALAFLVSIFRKAETDIKGGNVTVRQLIEEAEARIPVEFADQPELRAALEEALNKVRRGIARRTPRAMILTVRGAVQLHSANGSQKVATPQMLVTLDDRLTVPEDAQLQLVYLSDLHKEWIRPGREVTITDSGSAPTDAVRERDKSVPMTFAHLPKGTFYMGWGVGDRPATKVEVAEDFEIAIHTVTQGQWQAVMGRNPSFFSRTGEGQSAVADISDEELKLFPVERVSWNDCQEFIKKLNEMECGRGWVYRLPTEIEWEYACRGGATTEEECSFQFYFDRPTNDLSSFQANFNGNVPVADGVKGPWLQRPTRVGSYPANKLGICDMHGNVQQWCSNVVGRVSVVYRGSRWSSPGSNCRAASRNSAESWEATYSRGLRLVRVPAAQAIK